MLISRKHVTHLKSIYLKSNTITTEPLVSYLGACSIDFLGSEKITSLYM